METIQIKYRNRWLLGKILDKKTKKLNTVSVSYATKRTSSIENAPDSWHRNLSASRRRIKYQRKIYTVPLETIRQLEYCNSFRTISMKVNAEEVSKIVDTIHLQTFLGFDYAEVCSKEFEVPP